MTFVTKIYKDHPALFRVLAAYLALVAAVYLILLAPKIKTRKGGQENLIRLEAEVKRNQEAARGIALPDPEEKAKWTASRAEPAQTPTENDIPRFLQELARQTQNSQIPDASFSVGRTPPPGSPGAPVRMSDFLIKVSFQGQYRDLALFLKDLNRLSQRVTVESLELKKASPLIQAEMQLRPYRLGPKK